MRVRKLSVTLVLIGLSTAMPVNEDQHTLSSVYVEESDFAPMWDIENIPKTNFVCDIGGLSEKVFTPKHSTLAITLALQQLADYKELDYGDPQHFADLQQWFPHCDGELMMEANIGGFGDSSTAGVYRIVFEYQSACNDATFCGLVYSHGDNGSFQLCYGQYDLAP